MKYLEATLKQSTHVQNFAQEEEAGSENSKPGDQVTDGLEPVAVMFYQVFSQLYRN